MPRQNKTCNKYCRKLHAASATRMHCCAFARYAFEAFLLLFLFFTLPHVVYGIANTALEEENTASIVQPQYPRNRAVIVELFEWKFEDVNAECTNFLGPKGYAGVQLSPVTEHLLAGVQTQSWLARYQPISLKFATRSGSVEDFLAMSRACNAAGVRVYVDVVLNHMAGDTTKSFDSLLVGTAGSVANVSALDYNGVPFDALDFHSACILENYMDAYIVRNCQLNGQPDLNHSRVTVQKYIVEFLNQLIEMGVAGFRVDAAKYMWPADLKSIFSAVNNLNSDEFDFEQNSRPNFYQEVVDLGMDAVSKTEYTGNGIVTEYLYAAELSTVFRGKVPLSSLINWGPAMGFLPHQDALVFVDTHESQHGYLKRELGKNELLSYKHQRRYVMATAFMLAHPYGRIKRILSSYHFAASDKERGPPTVATVENNSEQPSIILSPEFDISEQCIPSTGWVCEHRWPAIVNMLALVNALSATEDGVTNFQTYGPNHIAFCRGQKAFIAINNDAVLDYTTTVHTCLEPGVYCDVISGGRKADGNDCHGKRIVVKENGMADLILPAKGSIQRKNTIDIDNDNNASEVDDDEQRFDDYDDGRNDDYGDGDGDGNGDASVEWKGTAVDVDYGVIAIYIGSKLLNSNETIKFSNSETVLTDNITKTDADQVGIGTTKDFLFAQIVENNSGVVQEEKNESLTTQKSVEIVTEDVIKTNATEIATLEKPELN